MFACLLLIQMTIASCGVCSLPVAKKKAKCNGDFTG